MQKDLNPVINFPFHYVFPASARPRSADYESCVQTPAIRKKRRQLPSKSWRIAAPPPRRVAHSEHICIWRTEEDSSADYSLEFPHVTEQCQQFIVYLAAADHTGHLTLLYKYYKPPL